MVNVCLLLAKLGQCKARAFVRSYRPCANMYKH
jgi:hypothetical protein